MRSTAEYSLLDHRRNEEFLKELEVDPVVQKLTRYKQKWLYHVSRVEDSKIPKTT
jgi:hypothetical protein